ncbi:hypothetical protein L210DRAFT_3394880 [Boletus edulis BED1]|uniref:Uncharacterized protein n=1 Tax=Boletus edulis BED1 TaxID=1328754 RepID=A0AAD4C0W2_BOLED|nr:hypothetical protein L210DRAFT_3394880 [Boletus edulis BED1]
MQSAQKSTTSPLKRLALHSTTTCSSQATAYGKCIVATYTDVRKDCCKHEFEKFGQCLRAAVCLQTRGHHASPLTHRR